jgi:UDP-N-acetylmuramoyl-tripeptide--D-alanyl-D-alanine ligase
MLLNGEKPIIAITGSAGKTTVKNLLSAILREKWVIFESNDYNNTTEKTKEHAQRISFIHRAAVVEYGMAYPGVITEHCNILRPNIGIITSIGLAHIGNFNGSIEELAAGKSELLKGVKPNGMFFINADDENSKLIPVKEFKGKLFTVGISSMSDYAGTNVEFTDDGMSFDVVLSGKSYSFLCPMLGKHNVYNALFAIGAAHQLGFTPEEIERGLRNAKTPEHRLNIHKLRDGIIVIDDTVHAHPTAMKAALDVLEAIGKKKKIAVLGSMPELGDKIEEYHMELGEYVASKNIDFLYTYGNISVNIGAGAICAGFPASKINHKTPLYRRVMHRELLEMIEPGTAILVKGASRLDMYETVKFLCEQYKVE